tara:strand:+ start:129 stop:1169 length:1041 start_codon:yes stop_codon:yes gene_type:complete
MLNVKDVTRALIVDEGFIEPRIIKLDEIYIPKQDKDSGNNPTRYELDGQNITELQLALHYPDWSKPLMIVKEINGGKEINGKTYYYELVAGFHRFEALSRNLTTEWIFDVYDFSGKPEAESDIQALENDHAPHKKMNKYGVANWLKFQYANGWIKNTETDMNRKVEILKFVSAQTKTAGVNLAINETDGYKDVTIRSIQEIKEFLENDENYEEDNRPVYSHSGNLDPKRLEHGWTVKEGYEDEYLFNAMKAYHNTKKTSYFLNHIKTPKTGSVSDARIKMNGKFKELEDALESSVRYKKKHGRWPWRTEAYFKQDNHQDRRETYWIKETRLPRKSKKNSLQKIIEG